MRASIKLGRAAAAALALLFAGGWSELHAAQFDVLAAGILAMHRGGPPAPTPGPSPTPPAPAPSGQCENCHGTGRLGDGTVSVTCPVCNGTGRKTTAPAASTIRPQPTAIILPQAPALGGRWVGNCANGQCSQLRWEPDTSTARPGRYAAPAAAEYQMDCSSGACQMRRVR